MIVLCVWGALYQWSEGVRERGREGGKEGREGGST